MRLSNLALGIEHRCTSLAEACGWQPVGHQQAQRRRAVCARQPAAGEVFLDEFYRQLRTLPPERFAGLEAVNLLSFGFL
jgi:hypothetical protein